MKIYSVQNYPQIKFTGLVKSAKTTSTISIINPTLEDLKKLEERSKKQMEELGLTVIKEVKLRLGKALQPKLY